jgi:uncharacterized protein (TIGR02266 family)
MMSRPDRYHVDIPVDLSTRGHFVSCRITNIARGGVFIQSAHPLPFDSEVELVFALPGERAIRATGRVIWNYDMAKGSIRLLFGSGIKFIGMTAEDKARLEACLETLAASVQETEPEGAPVRA